MAHSQTNSVLILEMFSIDNVAVTVAVAVDVTECLSTTLSFILFLFHFITSHLQLLYDIHVNKQIRNKLSHNSQRVISCQNLP